MSVKRIGCIFKKIYTLEITNLTVGEHEHPADNNPRLS